MTPPPNRSAVAEPGAAPKSLRGAATLAAEAVLPVVMLLAVLVVLVPVPAGLVDFFLAANLAVSALALAAALVARTPLEMSVFPTFLLGATLVRLVLNISTTRLILTRAAVEGESAAGEVVRGFGEFVSGNSVVVGAVIFAIIAVIQFVVITAGATRTGEVAARFALDGLPGRQMAIDTEVQAGTITREQASVMRLELQRNADFHAHMDGASRFVRGEAVAGVVITLVNLLGGLAIGVGQHGMAVDRAVEVYSKLTIGDGLVTSLPSLLVSVATGLLISRSSHATDLSGELRRQFGGRPAALVVTAAFLAVLAFTKLPFAPLAGLAVLLAAAAWLTSRGQGRRADPSAAAVSAKANAGPVATAAIITDELLADETIVVELGRGLVHLVSGEDAALPRRSASLRSALAVDLGIVLPKVVYRDAPSLDAQSYRVIVAGEPACEGEVRQGCVLALPAAGEPLGVEGAAAEDPAGGPAGAWIAPRQVAQARRADAIVLDSADVIARAIEAAVRSHADTVLTRASVSQLVESLRAAQPAAVEGVVPGLLSLPLVHRTLQLLVRENVPIRPLATVLELMADHASEAAEPAALAERVRQGLAKTICRRARSGQARLSVVRLAESAVDALLSGDAGRGRGESKILGELRRAVSAGGGRRAIVVPQAVRRRVRDLVARQSPAVAVLSEEEVAGEPGLDLFATVGGELSKAAA